VSVATTLQALIKEKSKWDEVLTKVDNKLMQTKSNGSDSPQFQEACNNIYYYEAEIEKIKARIMKYKKYSNYISVQV
jgi:hypothetical protein